jgi:hypothetical protein
MIWVLSFEHCVEFKQTYINWFLSKKFFSIGLLASFLIKASAVDCKNDRQSKTFCTSIVWKHSVFQAHQRYAHYIFCILF